MSEDINQANVDLLIFKSDGNSQGINDEIETVYQGRLPIGLPRSNLGGRVRTQRVSQAEDAAALANTNA